MAGTVAVSTASSAAKKDAKTKKPSTHPPFSAMIVDAVKALKDYSGSSRQAILKYILTKHNVGDEGRANYHLKLALKKGVSSGALTQVKGAGASGSFKVVDEKSRSETIEKKLKTEKKVSTKPTKRAIAKSPTVKKSTVFEASKKTVA